MEATVGSEADWVWNQRHNNETNTRKSRRKKREANENIFLEWVGIVKQRFFGRHFLLRVPEQNVWRMFRRTHKKHNEILHITRELATANDQQTVNLKRVYAEAAPFCAFRGCGVCWNDDRATEIHALWDHIAILYLHIMWLAFVSVRLCGLLVSPHSCKFIKKTHFKKREKKWINLSRFHVNSARIIFGRSINSSSRICFFFLLNSQI